MEALEQWFKENGGYLHPSVQLAQDEEYGLHFLANGVIESGTHALSVPHHLSLSNLNAQVDTNFPVFKSHAKYFTVEALSFFYLMAQWLNKDQSFWKPYLETLPSPEQEFETPIFFDDGDRTWLEGTDLHPTLLGREAAWKGYWEDGVKVLESAGMDVTHYTWTLFRWAATIFSSRSFNPLTIAPQDGKHWTAYKHNSAGYEATLLEFSHLPEGWEKFSVLFPLMDVPNHVPSAKVDWAYNPDTFDLTVAEKVDAGSQVFNNYGPKSSEELLMGYGFCTPNNPHDGLLLTMRPPPQPLQEMLKVTHPNYFKPSGEWSGEAATYRVLRSKLNESANDSIFTQAWAAIPAPLAELFCYLVQLERGVDVVPIEDAEDYLYRGYGTRFLPRIAFYITMSLIPKSEMLETVNETLPSEPSNSRQAAAKIYRDAQYEVINTVQDRMSDYLKDLQPEAISSTQGSAMWTLEDALEVLEKDSPDAYKSFKSALKYLAGTTKLRKIRGSEEEENLWTIYLCFAYLAYASQPESSGTGLLNKWMKTLIAEYGAPELQDGGAEDEMDEEAAGFLGRVQNASMFLPGSLWTNPAWTSDFVLDWGMRISKSHGTFMDVGEEEDEEQDVRYLVYLHIDEE